MNVADVVIGEGKRYYINWWSISNLGLWYRNELKSITIYQIFKTRLLVRNKI